jgi:hypothetical protein
MIKMTMKFNKWLHPIKWYKWYKSRTIRLILQKEMDKWMSEHEEDFQDMIRDFHLYGYAIVKNDEEGGRKAYAVLSQNVNLSRLCVLPLRRFCGGG